MERFSSLIAQRITRTAVVVFAIAMMLGLCPTTPAFASPTYQEPAIDAKTNYVPGEVLVKLENGTTSLGDASRVLSAAQLSNAVPIPDLDVWKLGVTPGEEMEQIRKLESLPGVEYAEPNYYVYAQEEPNDPRFSSQWGLPKINAPAGWDYTHGSSSVVIAIVDTGIDGTHVDLGAKVIAGYNYVPATPVPIPAHSDSDDSYHGTHVAGIAAAITDNSIGVAGVSWESLLMPVKVLDSSGHGDYADVALGVRYAADHGAQVINMSLGGNEDQQTLRDAVEYAYGKGCLLLASSGNYGWSTLLYPARYSHVMGVGRTNADDTRYSGSNYGEGLNVMAPGSSIYSTMPGNRYDELSGTSMSCPFASGLAALLWAVEPDATNADVQQYMQENAVDLGGPGWDPYYGYGRIDVLGSLSLLGALTVLPDRAPFVADLNTAPLPDSRVLSVRPEVSASVPISWTLEISPASTSWITVMPLTGTVSGQQEDAIQLDVTKEGLDFGKHSCELLFTGNSASWTTTTSVGVDLYYVPELSTYVFPTIVKTYVEPD